MTNDTAQDTVALIRESNAQAICASFVLGRTRADTAVSTILRSGDNAIVLKGV